MSYPIVLPHDQIARILDRRASLLVMTRRLRSGRLEVQDALVVRRNTAHRRASRIDLQSEPTVFAIEVLTVEKRQLLEDLDLVAARRTGHQTLEDFYLDWLKRRRHVEPGLTVHFHTFRIAEDARYLHAKIHRAYTTNPAEAVDGEQQALSREEQARYAKEAFDRDDAMRRQRVKEAAGRPLEDRVRDLERAKRDRRLDISREMRVIRQRVDRAINALPDDSV